MEQQGFLKKLIRLVFSKEFIMYGIMGVLATIVNWAVHALVVNHMIALVGNKSLGITITTIIAVIVSILNGQGGFLNALKELAGIDHELHVISREAIEPIQTLKTEYLGGNNPRLHTDEILIALAMSAVNDRNARMAMEQLHKLKGCQVHTSVMLSNVDIKTFKRLGVDLTSEPVKKQKTEEEVI